MTELGYRPDQTPQGAAQERFIFVDPADRKGREFEVYAAQSQSPVRGADSPEIYQALEDAHNAAQEVKREAAARTPEQAAGDAELAQAIDWNAQTIEVTREYTEVNGF